MFSAFIKDIDSRPDPSVWGTRLPFNTLCAEYSTPTTGWIHSIAFSPSGNAVAYVSHDSSVSIAYPTGEGAPPILINVRTPLLPFLSLVWTNENEIVAGGHDCQPILFHGDEEGWYSIRGNELIKGNLERVSMILQREVLPVEMPRHLLSTCLGTWTGKEVLRLLPRIRRFLLFTRIQSSKSTLRCTDEG